MNELSIKIKIADREYPMKVTREEEEKIRGAGKLINDKIKRYREQFGIDDKQDLLAMVAFDCLVDKMAEEETLHEIDEAVAQKVNHISQLVSQAL